MSCKIYCIECNITGEKYIGSTIKKHISDRITHHKYRRSCSCKDIIERGNYIYYLLEEVEETNRLIREQYWIDNTDKCINKNRTIGLTIKDYTKKYREVNKEKHTEYRKFRNSWGGEARSNNNLLMIDLSLFK